MKKIRFILCSFLLTFLAGSSLQAQSNKLKLGINYTYGMPLGGFKSDLVDKASPRGFSADVLYSINPVIAVGGAIGFQDYYQKYPRQVYDLDKNSQVSAVLTNSIQQMPLLVKASFTPAGFSSFPLQPYLNVAAGLNFINFDQYLGEFGSREASTAFTARAGAGVIIPIANQGSTGIRLGANYNYTPYTRNGYNGLDTWDLQAGIYFALK